MLSESEAGTHVLQCLLGEDLRGVERIGPLKRDRVVVGGVAVHVAVVGLLDGRPVMVARSIGVHLGLSVV